MPLPARVRAFVVGNPTTPTPPRGKGFPGGTDGVEPGHGRSSWCRLPGDLRARSSADLFDSAITLDTIPSEKDPYRDETFRYYPSHDIADRFRAAFQLFLVSEVHPFNDGNGRVARTFMCAELSAADQARILIPIVFRNEYQTALRALSRDGNCALYVRVLLHAWRWTASMPWHDRAAVEGRLLATHALMDSTDAERTGVRLNLP